jgi:hypothetical protein
MKFLLMAVLCFGSLSSFADEHEGKNVRREKS